MDMQEIYSVLLMNLVRLHTKILALIRIFLSLLLLLLTVVVVGLLVAMVGLLVAVIIILLTIDLLTLLLRAVMIREEVSELVVEAVVEAHVVTIGAEVEVEVKQHKIEFLYRVL
jgi:hypothetical protein